MLANNVLDFKPIQLFTAGLVQLYLLIYTVPPAYDEVEILENTQEESEITLQVPSLPSSPSPEGSVANSPTNGEAETVD